MLGKSLRVKRIVRELHSEAVFFTADHFMFGSIMTAPRRFSDVLSDPMVSWITIIEAELTRTNEPQAVVATFPEMLLAKEHIMAVAITGEPLYDDERRLLRYSHRNPERLYNSVPPYDIEGAGHLGKAAELHTIFSTEAREFLPFTEASIVLTSNPDVHLRAEVILVNRRAICSLSRSKEVSEEGKTEDQPSQGAPSAEKE